MRTTLYSVAAIAALAVLPQGLVRSVLASTAATLIEATPFLLAGVLLARIPRLAGLIAYLGCGCTRGPSARSIPAAAATWLLFGPLVASARVVAGILAARLIAGEPRVGALATTRASTTGAEGAAGCAHVEPIDSRPHTMSTEAHSVSLTAELNSLLPAALIAASVLMLTPPSLIANAGMLGQIGLGLLLGFLAAPCALGTVAIAGALHAVAPTASIAFLCIAGIVDLRSISTFHWHNASASNSSGLAIVACTLLLVAARHGGALVNPRACVPLAATGIVSFALALHNRTRKSRESLVTLLAPVVMIAGTMISAPEPLYHATETTMSDLFVGEQLSFTGVLDRGQNADALVRFAITCCRADATPVAIRLARTFGHGGSQWYRASGTIVRIGDELRLRADHLQPIVPPTDPFIYR